MEFSDYIESPDRSFNTPPEAGTSIAEMLEYLDVEDEPEKIGEPLRGSTPKKSNSDKKQEDYWERNVLKVGQFFPFLKNSF